MGNSPGKESLINEREVIERILRHLGLWEQGIRVHSGTDPPPECTIELWLEDPFPDYDTEPVLKYAKNWSLAAGTHCPFSTAKAHGRLQPRL